MSDIIERAHTQRVQDLRYVHPDVPQETIANLYAQARARLESGATIYDHIPELAYASVRAALRERS